MNYEKYALVLINDFLEVLKTKKRLKTLPKILTELERIVNNEKREGKTQLVLKEKSFFKKYKSEISKFSNNFNIENLEIVENPKIIGGYILKNKKYKIDNSYKTRLLKIYQKITK